MEIGTTEEHSRGLGLDPTPSRAVSSRLVELMETDLVVWGEVTRLIDLAWTEFVILYGDGSMAVTRGGLSDPNPQLGGARVENWGLLMPEERFL